MVGFWEDLIGQALAFSKTPLDLLRGSGGEEKVLKNAKDACATEALEIATYTAIERLARAVGDDETADLAQRILADEERMLQRIMREIPKLTDAVVRAEVKGQPSYDITTTGAGEAVRRPGRRPPAPRARPRPLPSAPLGKPARSRAWPRSKVRSRAPSPEPMIWRSRDTTA